jgi:hypothetical protein
MVEKKRWDKHECRVENVNKREYEKEIKLVFVPRANLLYEGEELSLFVIMPLLTLGHQSFEQMI